MVTHVFVPQRAPRRARGHLADRAVPQIMPALCGGERTINDLSASDAVRAFRQGVLKDWVACPDCRAVVERSA